MLAICHSHNNVQRKLKHVLLRDLVNSIAIFVINHAKLTLGIFIMVNVLSYSLLHLLALDMTTSKIALKEMQNYQPTTKMQHLNQANFMDTLKTRLNYLRNFSRKRIVNLVLPFLVRKVIQCVSYQ